MNNFMYGRHIDDVITSLRRGFEMVDHLQIKGDPIEDFDIGHHKSAHNLHGTHFLSLGVLTIT